MKRLLLAFFLWLPLHLHAQDILINGDFNDGAAHWKGDAEGLPVGGIFITLKDKWTQLTQTFRTHETALDFSITYRLSPDTTFSAKGLKGPFSNGNFIAHIDINPFMGSYSVKSANNGILLVDSPAGSDFHRVIFQLSLGSAENEPQTITGSISHLVPHDDKIFCLLFPPGNGTLTLTKLTLTPHSTDASPANSAPPPEQPSPPSQ